MQLTDMPELMACRLGGAPSEKMTLSRLKQMQGGLVLGLLKDCAQIQQTLDRRKEQEEQELVLDHDLKQASITRSFGPERNDLSTGCASHVSF